MSKDIFIVEGDLSSHLLKKTRSKLDSASEKLGTINYSPMYRGPTGYSSLYPASVSSEVIRLKNSVDAVREKLRLYADILGTGPGTICDVDALFKNDLVNDWSRFGFFLSKGWRNTSDWATELFANLFYGKSLTGTIVSLSPDTEDSRNRFTEATNDNESTDKLKAIVEFELSNPKEAKVVNEILEKSGLTDGDIENIKYIVYSAPEPYRSLYLQSLGKYGVDLFNKWQFAYNSNYAGFSLLNLVNIKNSPDNLSRDPRGAYNTFFHESGHAIDDVNELFGNETGHYEYDGMPLYEIIANDVHNNINNYIIANYPNLTSEQRYTIMRSMNLTDDAEFRYCARDVAIGDSQLDAIRTEILDYYYDYEMEGYDNEAVCDIYGGITNNVFYREETGNLEDGSVHLGHVKSDKKYWYRSNIEEVLRTGDYSDTFNPKDQQGTQAAELWAEFFAAQMTQDEAALANMKDHFPTAYKAMEQMAQDMLKC